MLRRHFAGSIGESPGRIGEDGAKAFLQAEQFFAGCLGGVI